QVPRTCSARATLSFTFRSGMRRRSSNTMPSERRRRMRLPPLRRCEEKSPTWTTPAVGSSSMVIKRRRVGLPGPLAPSTTTLSPAGTSQLAPARASFDPNRLDTPAKRITPAPLLVLDLRARAKPGDPGVVLLLELHLAHQVGELILHFVERVRALDMAVEHLE